MSNHSIKVFLADDHRLIAAGFKHALKSRGVDVVDVAYTLDEVQERYESSGADVLVIDMRFDTQPGSKTGLEYSCELLAKDPAHRIIILSQFDDQFIIEKAYRVGVLAFVRKDESIDTLYSAIKKASTGASYFSPEIAQQLAISAIQPDSNPRRILEPAELNVFVLSGDGASIAEVAAQLHISTKTAGTLLRCVKTKLGVESQADITKLAIKYGFTTVEPTKM
jgi:two-component system invasion response regulator UvrY